MKQKFNMADATFRRLSLLLKERDNAFLERDYETFCKVNRALEIEIYPLRKR